MGDLPSLALSFDDVLLLPAHSAVLPGEVNVSTKFASIELNVPVLSSAMDTVTEAELAIALAREGGLGVIHRNMPIDQQSDQVARVKRSENTVIQSPHTVSPETRLGELHRLMHEKGVSGFPVVDKDGRLAVRTVEVAWRRERSVLVKKGLSAGQEVIVSRLPSAVPGMLIRKAPSKSDTVLGRR